ncbi:MAG: NADPH-dependent F420 reductase [Chloroflexi bacterium RBG_16_48_8]|nr:MAG: NADPH-dependent F420 reductase [Chloroflexi bacterium RBG_16_48_8]
MDEAIILTIAILGGTGKAGPGLALRWANAGYRIIIGSRQAEKAQRIAQEINEQLGIESIQGMQNEEAAKAANICVLTVVQSAHKKALHSFREALKGKILVDTTARVDFQDPKPPKQPSAARMAQDLLGPDVRVVAAFQTIPAHALRENINESMNMDVLVFADDDEAADEVIMLAEAGGMGAYHAGDLDCAVVAEGLSAVMIELNRRYKSKKGAIKIAGLEK